MKPSTQEAKKTDPEQTKETKKADAGQTKGAEQKKDDKQTSKTVTKGQTNSQPTSKPIEKAKDESTTTMKTIKEEQTTTTKKIIQPKMGSVTTSKTLVKPEAESEEEYYDVDEITDKPKVEPDKDEFELRSPEREGTLKDRGRRTEDERFNQRKSTATDDSINSRVQYLEEELQRQNHHNFATLWSHICGLHNKQIETVKIMLKLDPTQGTRMWLGKQDISAELAGQAIEIRKCIPIVPEKIYWDKKINSTCFNDLPITWNSQIYFVNDGSIDMKRKGEIVKCENQRISVFKNEKGQWTSSKGTAHVIPVTHDVSWHSANHPIVFDKPSVFNDDATATSLAMLWSYSEKINNVEIDLDTIISTENGENWIEKTMDAIKEKSKATIDDFKENFSFPIWKEIQEFWKDFKLVFFIGVPILLLLALFIYFYPWISPVMSWCRNRRQGRRRRLRRPSINAVQVNAEEGRELGFMPPVYNVSTERRRLPHVMVLVNGVRCRALVDTGSAITFCSAKLARTAKLPLENTNVFGTAANGSKVEFMGKAKTWIEFGKKKVFEEILVAQTNHSPADLVIGHDLCYKLQVSIDFANNTMQMMNEAIPILALLEGQETEEEEKPTVMITEKTTIKKGDNFLFAFATTPLINGSTYLATQAKNFIVSGLMIGATLSIATGDLRIPIRILNTTNTDLTLHPGTIIAELERITEKITMNSGEVGINAIIDNDEYVPEECDISKDLPQFPVEGISKEDFLMEKLDLSESSFTEAGKKKLRDIILKCSDAFVGPDGIIGNYTGPIVHRIDLIDESQYVADRPRRVPPALQNEVERQIEQMLKQAIIRPSISPFQSQIVMVRKADKTSFRMAVDYRKLNAATKRQANFLPLISEIVDQVAGKTIYSCVDMMSGYHQIPMHPEHIERTAFAVTSGIYEFCRMPFGLSSAPSTFQRVMDAIKKQLMAVIFVYLDDIIIASLDEEQHLKDVEEVLNALAYYGLKLRIDKCMFGKATIKYLGFRISREGIQPDPANIEKVKNFTKPTTLHQLRSFIGACSYFRKFVPNFARIMSPLNTLTTKGEQIKHHWTSEHDEAFDQIIEKLTTAPVLKPPKFGSPFEIETDASKDALGAVLLQRDEKNELHPIQYYSRKMNKHEQRYVSIELEALAVVAALREFRPYIDGAGTTIVRTDSSAVCGMMKSKNLEGRLAKFQISIQAYDVQFVHRAGKDNKFCDYISRYPTNAISLRSGKVVASEINIDTMAKEQKKEFPDIYAALKDKSYPTNPEEKAKLDRKLMDLTMKNKVIYYRNLEESDDYRILVPYVLRQQIIKEFHNNPLQGGHLGQEKTLEKLKRRAYWPCMITDIKETVKSCEVCQKGKVNAGNKSKEPIQAIEAPSKPFDRVHVDVLGPLPKARNGEIHILVTVDAFSKWVIASPMRDQTSRTTADVFVDTVITKYGAPNMVISDNGRNFVGTVFKELSEIYGFVHNTVTPYHQSANGEAERQNRTLSSMLRGAVTTGGDDWPDFLQKCIFAYNTSIHSSINQSPFFVLFGRDPRLPTDVILQIPDNKIYADISDYVQETALNLQKAWRITKENMVAAQEAYVENDTITNDAKPKQLKIGQLVLRQLDWKKKIDRHKFGPKYHGPYRVLQIIRPNAFIKELGEHARPMKIHLNKLKPFYEPYVLPFRSTELNEAMEPPGDEAEDGSDAERDAESGSDDGTNTTTPGQE